MSALELPTPPPWMSQAVCASVDAEAWWPEKGQMDQARVAVRICRTCPVVAECLDFALTNNEREGVWGGVLARDRRALRRDVA